MPACPDDAKADERCRLLELVAMNTRSLVVVTDAERRIRWVNPAYTALTGWTLDEVRGRRPGSFLHGPQTNAQDLARLADLLRSGQRVEGFEIVNHKKSGEPYWVSLHIEPVRGADGTISAYVAIQHDITGQKAAEALARENALLEQAARTQMDVLSHVSHELRTPLHAVIGFTEMIERREAAGLSGQAREHLQQIRRSAGHLMRMVNDILDLARLREGQLPLERMPVALVPLVRDVFAMLEPAATRAEVRLEMQAAGASDGLSEGATAGATAAADPTRLRQVLINLVANAVQYNRRGGRVTVDVAESPAGAEAVELAVTDDGPGIAPDDLTRLFEPFYRVRPPMGAAARASAGSGLGLPIARSLVEAMGGTLTVRSTPGAGATFTVRLPLAPAAAAPAPSAAAEPAAPQRRPGARRLRVLYIEDNAVNRHIVAAYLDARPAITLVCSETADEGIAAARRLRPDLILCDVQLPDGSGLDVLQALQADAALASTPCVAFSASGDAASIDEMIRAGFSDYLPKPIDAEAFLRSIDRLLAELDVDGGP